MGHKEENVCGKDGETGYPDLDTLSLEVVKVMADSPLGNLI